MKNTLTRFLFTLTLNGSFQKMNSSLPEVLPSLMRRLPLPRPMLDIITMTIGHMVKTIQGILETQATFYAVPGVQINKISGAFPRFYSIFSDVL